MIYTTIIHQSMEALFITKKGTLTFLNLILYVHAWVSMNSNPKVVINVSFIESFCAFCAKIRMTGTMKNTQQFQVSIQPTVTTHK